MKRWALGLAILLAVAAGGLWWAWNSLDFVVKAAIEHYGPRALGVPVAVREVRISTADGRGTIRGLEVGNPPGYSAPRALRAGTITASVDPATLASDVVVIRDILVDAPEIAYELRGGGNNLDAIRRNVERYVKEAGGEPAGKPGEAGRAKGRRYLIGRITIREARVTMTNPLLKGGGISFKLGDIDLRDVGKRSGGVTAAEAASLVAGAIVSRVAQSVLTNVDALRKGGVEGALDALRGLIR